MPADGRAPAAQVALFPGDSELQQLLHIFKLLGTPSEDEWPGVTKLRDWHEFPNWAPQNLAQARRPGRAAPAQAAPPTAHAAARRGGRQAQRTRRPHLAPACILLPLPDVFESQRCREAVRRVAALPSARSQRRSSPRWSWPACTSCGACLSTTRPSASRRAPGALLRRA